MRVRWRRQARTGGGRNFQIDWFRIVSAGMGTHRLWNFMRCSTGEGFHNSGGGLRSGLIRSIPADHVERCSMIAALGPRLIDACPRGLYVSWSMLHMHATCYMLHTAGWDGIPSRHRR